MIDLVHHDRSGKTDRHGNTDDANSDDYRVDETLHHGAMVPQLDEPAECEAFEGVGGRIGRRVEGGYAHDHERAE